jgi:hypothetical protein
MMKMDVQLSNLKNYAITFVLDDACVAPDLTKRLACDEDKQERRKQVKGESGVKGRRRMMCWVLAPPSIDQP